MVRIVHFSDWHGGAQPLPEADLYVCTGDMYPDTYGYKTPQTAAEQEWWRPELRDQFGSPLAPIVCVRGNHDMHPIGPIFGLGLTYELDRASRPVKVRGLKIGVLTGVRAGPPWSLEQDARMDERLAALPKDLDVLISHGPAAGLFDHDGVRAYGHHGMREWLFDNKPRAFLHGHVHEAACEPEIWGSTIVSNAATRWNTIDLEGNGGR